MHMKQRPLLVPSILGIVIAQAAGGLGSLVTFSEIPAWYATLAKPTWQPPNWLFGPVWTVLYTLIGLAGARIWSKTKQEDSLRRIFAAQLFLNALWTPVFFGAHNLLGGLVIIYVMDVLIMILIARLWKSDRVAMWMLVPYLAWILFATFLNAAILGLNP